MQIHSITSMLLLSKITIAAILHWNVCFLTEAVEENRVQAEERGNKLKQLLVKTKKELADLHKQV